MTDILSKPEVFEAELNEFMMLYAGYSHQCEIHRGLTKRLERMKPNSRNRSSVELQKHEAKTRIDDHRRRYLEQKQKVIDLYSAAALTQARLATLNELAAQAQELDMGY